MLKKGKERFVQKGATSHEIITLPNVRSIKIRCYRSLKLRHIIYINLFCFQFIPMVNYIRCEEFGTKMDIRAYCEVCYRMIDYEMVTNTFCIRKRNRIWSNYALVNIKDVRISTYGAHCSLALFRFRTADFLEFQCIGQKVGGSRQAEQIKWRLLANLTFWYGKLEILSGISLAA